MLKEQCPKTPQEVKNMGQILYASVVGSLMYAMLCTRPDICYSVGIVSRYQSNPRRDYWTVFKNILKYLRRKKYYMLLYDNKDLILTGYIDFDFQCGKDAKEVLNRPGLFLICIYPSFCTVTIVVQLQIQANLKAINREST